MSPPTVKPVEAQFLAKLREHPSDDDARAVYADWLEEQSRMQESEFLKLQLTLKAMKPTDFSFEQKGNRLRELAKAVDQKWRTLVAHAPIERCEARFDFVCPKKWEALTPTSKDNVRYCDGCKKDVHYANSLIEAFASAQNGHCVVVDLIQLRAPNDIDAAGMPQPFPPLMGAAAPPADFVPLPTMNPPAPLPLHNVDDNDAPKKNIIERIKSIFSR